MANGLINKTKVKRYILDTYPNIKSIKRETYLALEHDLRYTIRLAVYRCGRHTRLTEKELIGWSRP